MAKNFKLQNIVFSSFIFAAFMGVQSQAAAQSANDSATLTVRGKVVLSTCSVQFRNQGSATATDVGAATLELETIKASQFTGGGASTPVGVGTAKAMIVTLGTSNGDKTASACQLGGNAKWDMTLSAQSTQVAGTSTFLKSATGTNALVGLKSAVVTTPSSGAVTLNPNWLPLNGSVNAGTGNSTFSATNQNGIAISAQWVHTGTTPTAGEFSSPVTLTAVYN